MVWLMFENLCTQDKVEISRKMLTVLVSGSLHQLWNRGLHGNAPVGIQFKHVVDASEKSQVEESMG